MRTWSTILRTIISCWAHWRRGKQTWSMVHVLSGAGHIAFSTSGTRWSTCFSDLEYDPTDYHQLLGPLEAGQADVVYGSRFVGSGPHRVLYFWHSVGNRLLTLLSNMLTNLNMTDMETCYKVFRREVIQSIRLEEDRFGFEPEITVKIAKRNLRVYEVGIKYWGRTYEEGKKIGWKDGFRALWCLAKYWWKEPQVAPG